MDFGIPHYIDTRRQAVKNTNTRDRKKAPHNRGEEMAVYEVVTFSQEAADCGTKAGFREG